MADEMTLEEYQTKAMLLGMVYDPRDHTFNNAYSINNMPQMDADTMEALDGSSMSFGSRVHSVTRGKIGPKWLHALTPHEKERLWVEGLEQAEPDAS